MEDCFGWCEHLEKIDGKLATGMFCPSAQILALAEHTITVNIDFVRTVIWQVTGRLTLL